MRRCAVPLVLLAALVTHEGRAEVPESPLDSAARGPSADPRLAEVRAVRSAPFGPLPLVRVPDLVRLAGGRDPTLAPAAAVALHRIAERAMPGDAARAEVLDAELTGWIGSLRALSEDTAVRGDIRRLAGEAAGMLARAE